MAGTFDNIYVIGKAYMFEICDTKQYRIIGFSLKSIIMLLGINVGPWIGHLIYTTNDHDFSKTCAKLSLIFAAQIVLFFIVFYYCDDQSKDN